MIGAMLTLRACRSAYDTLNRKDVAALLRHYADDAVFEFPGRSPLGGRHEGKAEIAGFFRTWFDRMETVHFTVKHVAVANPWALGGTNTAMAEWVLDATIHGGAAFHAEGVTVFDLRGGKVARARDYLSDPGAIEEAWQLVDAAAAPATPMAAVR